VAPSGWAVTVAAVFKIDMEALRALPAKEQAEALALLEEAEQIALWNPLEKYRPASGLHASFHASFDPLKAFFGGNRAGKTTTAIVDDIIQACPEELLPAHLKPFKKWSCPFYCRIMTPDMERTMKPVIWQKLREWMPKDMLKKGSFDAALDTASNSLRMECGCRFDFLSYEMKLDKFGGAALHRNHFDESPPKSIRIECLMRLIDFNGDEVYSLTPLKGLDFTYREIWKKRSELVGGDPNIFAIMVSMMDNPHLSGEARERILAAVADEKELAARRDGAFMSEEGLVYPMWESVLTDIVASDQTIQAMETVIGIDPGVRFCGITYVSYDDENRSRTWRAIKRQNWVAEDYAKEIKRTLGDRGLRLDDVHIVIDPAAVARSLATGENIADELAKYDIHCVLGQNEVRAGVMQIRRRIRNQWCAIEETDETIDLREELEELQLDIDPDADDGEFKIKKANDHVADSWRYNHMERSWLPEAALDPSPDPRPWWAIAQAPVARPPFESVMGYGA
jgi:phage terminase large subunit-like protein